MRSTLLAVSLFDSMHASSVRGAPVASGPRRRPLLVLSTGLGVFLAAYTTLAEQLASQGYFVFGIEHPGGSGSIVLRDGTLLPLDPQLEVPTEPILAEAAEDFARDIEAVTTAALDAKSSLGAFAWSWCGGRHRSDLLTPGPKRFPEAPLVTAH